MSWDETLPRRGEAVSHPSTSFILPRMNLYTHVGLADKAKAIAKLAGLEEGTA